MAGKIYTRTGDKGTTGLYGLGRVAKTHPRIHAVGAVDELNAHIGLAISFMGVPSLTRARLESLQPDLFAIGSHLVNRPPEGDRKNPPMPDFPLDRPEEMEQWIDEAHETLPPLNKFIMPGGSQEGAALHVARTVCRRAERAVLELPENEPVHPSIGIYLNRLSDLLFAWARLVNHRAHRPEVQWLPEKH